MKKIIGLTMLAALFIGNLNAQTNGKDYNKEISFGLKVGTNFSNVYDEQGDAFVANSKFGLAIGGFLTIPIVSIIGVQPEFLFSQKGFQSTGSFLGNKYDFTRTTSYIDVPIFAAIKPSKYLSILIGPQYSYLINQKDEFVSSAFSNQQQKDFANDNIRKNILCLVGGVDINANAFVVGLRAGWDVQTNNGDGTSTVPRYKNYWYQFTVGARF